MKHRNHCSLLIILSLFIYYSIIIAIDQRNSYYIPCLIIILLGGINHFLHNRRSTTPFPALTKDEHILLLLLSLYTIYSVAMLLVWEQPGRRNKADLIPLFSVPFFLAVRQSGMTAKHIFLAISLGSLIAGLTGIYDRYVLELDRVLSTRHSLIPASGIVMSMALMSLHLAIRNPLPHPFLRMGFLVAALAGLTCTVLTGTRGAWLAFVVYGAATLLYALYTKRLTISITIILTAIVLLMLGGDEFSQRWQQAITDLQRYISGENRNSSLGLRLEFWKSAWDGFLQRPWLGWGNEGYLSLKTAQHERGLIIAQAADHFYGSAHNQYLDTLVRKGIIGFTLLIAILAIPCLLLVKSHQSRSKQQQCLSEIGMILIGSTCIYCLSDVNLSWQIGMLFYCVTILTILASLSATRRHPPTAGANLQDIDARQHIGYANKQPSDHDPRLA